MKEADEVIHESMKAALILKILTLFIKGALSEFLNSIFALSFLTFQVGMSLRYPAVLVAFFTPLIQIINQDLLESIEAL